MRKLCFLLLCLGFSLAGFAQTTEKEFSNGCGNGIDDDGDGFIDCFDADCGGTSECRGTYTGNDTECQISLPPGAEFGMVQENKSNERVTTTHGRFVIGDIDKDGVPEVVTAHSDNKKIYVLNGQTLEVEAQGTSSYVIDRYDIAIADVLRPGSTSAQIFVAEVECLQSNWRGCIKAKYYVSCWEKNGTSVVNRWRREVPARPFTIALADFNGDGAVELYFKNAILNAATGDVLVAPTGDWNQIDGGPVAVDILPEYPGLELVAGGEIYSVNLAAGTVSVVRKFNDIVASPNQWRAKFLSLGGDDFVNSQTSIADMNLDGNLDICMTGIDNNSKTAVFFWDVMNGDGKVYRPSNNWGNGAGRLNLADLDGDGEMNIAFVSGNKIFALEPVFDVDRRVTQLKDVNGWVGGIEIQEASSGYTSTTVFDFNNDGASEIVYRDEKSLYIIDGNGTFSDPIDCYSLTSNEYPIVADVDADGSTEICVVCQDGGDLDDIYSYANRGIIKTYKSKNDPWVSARKVWNQHAYFNVNVNDDLTIPKVQQKHHLSFSEDECGEGKNFALNSFLNQSAILNSHGCKTYPSADVTFVANPDMLNITPPTCPDVDFHVSFTLGNNGSVPITGSIPVSFYNGNPEVAGADHLKTEYIPVEDFAPGDQLDVPDITVTGTGNAFTLYVVLNDDGSAIPIEPESAVIEECNLGNNIASASIVTVPFALSTESTDHIQCGTDPVAANGSMRAYKLEGGTEQISGYEFYWFNGSVAGAPGDADHVGPQHTGMEPGTYTVYALHDEIQCSSDTAMVVIEHDPITIDATVNVDHAYTNCADPDGMLSVTPGTGNINDYTYVWFKGEVVGTSDTLSTTNTLGGRDGLTYSVVVTQKSTGCRTLETGSAPDETDPPVVTTGFEVAKCVPAASGVAWANVEGVTTGYTFYWYDGTTVLSSEDFLGDTYSGRVAGDYTVVAENDATGCRSVPVRVTVPDPAPFTVTANVTALQTSCASPNGAAAANVGGTTTGYTFTWFEGDNTTPPSEGTGATITGLDATEYTVLATNTTTGCTATAKITVGEDIDYPTVTPSVVSAQENCLPADGAVTATASGSAGPYNYYWFDGNEGTPDITAADFVGANYSGLVADTYTVVAVDVNTQCESPRATVDVDDETDLPAINTSITDQTSCDVANPNGAVAADVGGSQAGHKFRWFTGSDTTSFIVETLAFNNRAAGTYTVKAQNLASGCASTEVVTIDDLSKNPTLTLNKTDNGVCSGDIGFTGSVSATLDDVNGQPGHTYKYEWLKAGVVLPGEEGPEITGIDGGNYSVTVINEVLKCESDPVSIVVTNDVTLPTITTDVEGSTNCAGPANGAVMVTGVVPVGPYEYRWYAGNSVGAPGTELNLVSNPVADGLQGGEDYIVEVTLVSTGCKNTATVTLPDESELPVLGPLTKTNNTLCVGVNGTATIGTVTYQGNPVADPYVGYTLAWSNGDNTPTTTTLAAGTYSLTITKDDVDCTSDPVSITIDDDLTPPAIVLDATPQTSCDPAQLNGQIDAAVDVAGTLTTAGYTFTWYSGSNTSTPLNASNIDPGNAFIAIALPGNAYYTSKVVNNTTQCENTATVFVEEFIAIPRVELDVTQIVDCNNPGYITATVFVDVDNDGDEDELTTPGEYTDYLFTWDRGNSIAAPVLPTTGRVLEYLDGGTIALPADNYTAFVTNTFTHCVSPVITATLNSPAPLFDIETLVNTKPASCGEDQGVITAWVNESGTPTTTGYKFEWYEGTITNGPQTPPPTFYTDPPVSFQGDPLVVDPNNDWGTALYPAGAALPDPQQPASDLMSGPTLYGQASGTFTVVVTNSVGCKEYRTDYLPFLKEPVIVLADITPDDCLGDNGGVGIDIDVVPPADPSQYKIWLISGSNPELTPGSPPATYLDVIDGAAATGNGFSGLPSGVYTVLAQEDPADLITGCFSAPVLLDLRESLPPLLDLDAFVANTNCANPGDGSLEISLATDPSDPFHPAFPPPPHPTVINGAAPTYTISVEDSDDASVYTSTGHNSGHVQVIGGLMNDDFEVTVTSSYGCSTTRTYTVPFKPQVVEFADGNIDKEDALFCDPALETNARIEVTSLALKSGGVENIGDYHFEWFDNAGLTPAPVYADDGSTGGQLFENNVNGVLPGTVKAGSYWLRATKISDTPGSGGIGCESAPFRIDIDDDSEDPTISFNVINDRSCDEVNFDGQIEVSAENTSDPTAGYNFDWTAIPATSTVVTDDIDAPESIITNVLAGDLIGKGSYTIRVTNLDTQCYSDGTVSVLNNKLVVTANAQKIDDQDVCGPDGRIDVTSVGVGVLADYIYEWRKSDPAGALLVDNASNPIDGVILQAGTAAGEYPDMENGTYYVVAERTVRPGIGCRTSAVRVDVLDKRKYPVVTFGTLPNTSCTSADYDASITINAVTDGWASGSNYDFVWTGTPATIPPFASDVSVADASDEVSGYTTGASDNVGPGFYTVRVRNRDNFCETEAMVEVKEKKIPLSILSADVVDQTDCAPANGSITIDETSSVHMSLPGTYTFSWQKGGFPLTPGVNHEYTGAESDTYVISAVKTNAPALGCSTDPLHPFTVVLEDKTEKPVVELVATANNIACDDAQATGAMKVEVQDAVDGDDDPSNFAFGWFEGAGTVPPATPLLPIVPNISGIGRHATDQDYTVRVVDQASPNLGCVNTATRPVKFVRTTFSIAIDAESQKLCAPTQDGALMVTEIRERRNGVDYDITDMTQVGFRWADEAGNVLTSPEFEMGKTDLTNLLTGTYKLRVQNQLGCVSPQVTEAVVMDETSQPTIILASYTNPAICILPEIEGSLVATVKDDDPSGYEFEWFIGDNTGPDKVVKGTGIATTQDYNNIAYNDPLEYSVLVTNKFTNCSDTATYTLKTETKRIKVIASAVERTNCVIDDGSLFANTTEGAGTQYAYTWFAGTQVSSNPADVRYSKKNPLNVPLGVYTVIATDPNRPDCESIPATVEVTDAHMDPPVLAVQRNPLTYCDPLKPNGVASASVNGKIVGYQFDWFQGSVGGTHVHSGPDVKGLTATTYVVRATDVMTQCEGTYSIVIENAPLNIAEPTVVVLSHHTNCVEPNGGLSATVNGTTFGYLMQWYDGNSVKSAADATGGFYENIPDGTYTVTATDKTSGCVSEPVVTDVLPMREDPEFDIAITPTNCEQDVGSASIDMLNEVNVRSIVWDINGVEDRGAIVSHLPKGEFSVVITTTDECTASKTFVIEPELLVFNGVSRNNDGQNDIFEIACIQDYPQNNVKIYNRAGTLVYEANGYDNQDVFFDGVSNRGINLLGTDLPDGTYFYIIDKRNGSKPKTGYLELLR